MARSGFWCLLLPACLGAASEGLEHGKPRLGRIVLSHKTHREGPGGYFHVRDDLPLEAQLDRFTHWWNLSTSEGEVLRQEVSEALLKAVQRPGIQGKSAAYRLGSERVREMLEAKQIQTICEPVRLHGVEDSLYQRLKSEVLAIVAEHEAADVASKAHPINWVLSYGRTASYSLIAASGNVSDTSDLLTFDTQKKRFAHAEKYPAIDQLIKLFPDTTNWRINILHESDQSSVEAARFQASGFSPHRAYILHEVRDTVTGEMKTALRMKFHLPIVTNPYVDMHQYDRSYTFHQGEIYFFTNGCPHSVENRGNAPRIHLIWDMLLSEDTWERTFGEGPDLHEKVKRMTGDERQCEWKGYWHWTGFEQEPEKTWGSMKTYFQNLIDVSPPQECRAVFGVDANATSDLTAAASCTSGVALVSRWDAKPVDVGM